MKPLPLILLLLLVIPSCQSQGPQTLPPIEVYFSPKGGCTEAVVKEIDAAKNMILVQAYSFTSAPIAKALVDAHARGVNVQVILDKSQQTEKYSSADFVHHAGIPTFIDAKHQIAHNKIIILDGKVVITGSFNFTKNAEENNAENLLVIRSPELATTYAANWEAHVEHSENYVGKEKGWSEAVQRSDPVVAGEGYLASMNSAVFHQADCKSAAKISARNLVHYRTREEAIQAGKKPCDECNP
jgi:phosphatidylserine/phosphatidylglycerophosphate/cardiolipin synthase-like enzyme